MDQISTPWVTVHLAQLLSWHVMMKESSRSKMATEQDASTTDEMDKVIKMKDNVCVGPFQAEILKGKNSMSACTGYTHNGSTHQACRCGKLENMPTTPRTISVACIHHTLSW